MGNLKFNLINQSSSEPSSLVVSTFRSHHHLDELETKISFEGADKIWTIRLTDNMLTERIDWHKIDCDDENTRQYMIDYMYLQSLCTKLSNIANEVGYVYDGKNGFSLPTQLNQIADKALYVIHNKRNTVFDSKIQENIYWHIGGITHTMGKEINHFAEANKKKSTSQRKKDEAFERAKRIRRDIESLAFSVLP